MKKNLLLMPIAIISIMLLTFVFTACNGAKNTGNTPDGVGSDDIGKDPVEDKNPTEKLAYELSSDGTYYIVTGKKNSAATDIIIPSTHEGKPVTSIEDFAFYNYTGLTSITIPNSITSIGSSAISRERDIPKIPKTTQKSLQMIV